MSDGVSPPSPSPDRRWHGARARRAVDPVAARRKRILFVVASLLAVASVLVGLFFYIDPAINAMPVSLPIREYAFALSPGNRYAQEDGSAILEAFPVVAGHERNLAIPSQRRDQIEREIAELVGRRGKQPMVVHLTCLALARRGEAFLLAGDSQPSQPNSWLPLADVLKKLSEAQAPGVLLLLDVARPLADPRLGILRDDIAQVVRQSVEKHAGPKLAVLASCVDGQVSYASEELRLSVFAYYLAEGLRGAADGWGAEGVKNQHITVRELAEFVAVRTERFVDRAFGSRQTPHLWGSLDFDVVHVTAPGDRKAKPADRPKDDAPKDDPKGEKQATDSQQLKYPSWLLDGWRRRDALAARGDKIPAALIYLDDELLRIERRWRRGDDSAKLKERVAALVGRIDETWRLPSWSLPPLALVQTGDVDMSSPLAKKLIFTARAGLRSVQEVIEKELDEKKRAEELAKVRDAVLKGLNERLAEHAKEQQKSSKEPDAKAPAENAPSTKEPTPHSSYVAMRALLDALEQTPDPQVALFAVVGETLKKLKDSVGPGDGFVETVWLNRMTAFGEQVRRLDENWPAAQTRQAFKTMRAKEAVVAALVQTPAALPWIRARVQKAEELRRKGEKLLFGGGATDWPQADVPMRQAENDYQAALSIVGKIRSCRGILADAAAYLPGYLPFLLSQPAGGQEERLWVQAVDEGRRLLDRLAQPPESGTLTETGQELSAVLDELQRVAERQARDTAKRQSERDLLHVDDVLLCARLPAELRAELWQTARTASRGILEQIQKSDEQAVPQTTATAQSLAFLKSDGAGAAGASQALRRARLALQLLLLGEAPERDPVQREWEAAQGKSRADEFDPLAEKMGEAWLRLPDHFRNGRLRPEQAERISWIATVVDSSIGAEPAALPAALLQRQAVRDCRDFLATQSRREMEHVNQTDGARANEYSQFLLDAARKLQSP